MQQRPLTFLLYSHFLLASMIPHPPLDITMSMTKPYETNCGLWIWAIQIKFDWLIDYYSITLAGFFFLCNTSGCMHQYSYYQLFTNKSLDFEIKQFFFGTIDTQQTAIQNTQYVPKASGDGLDILFSSINTPKSKDTQCNLTEDWENMQIFTFEQLEPLSLRLFFLIKMF